MMRIPIHYRAQPPNGVHLTAVRLDRSFGRHVRRRRRWAVLIRERQRPSLTPEPHWLSYYRHPIYMLVFAAAVVLAVFAFGGSIALP